jgi:hypothetical protein
MRCARNSPPAVEPIVERRFLFAWFCAGHAPAGGERKIVKFQLRPDPLAR